MYLLVLLYKFINVEHIGPWETDWMTITRVQRYRKATGLAGLLKSHWSCFENVHTRQSHYTVYRV